MDAATLYAIVAVGSGPKRTTTQKFPTMTICEQVAQKLRKKSSMQGALYYCVKRKPDSAERAAVEAAKAQAAAKMQAAKKRQAGQAQPAGAGPIGMPRDFYSGTTPAQQ